MLEFFNRPKTYLLPLIVIAGLSFSQFSASETEAEQQQRIQALAETIKQLKAELNSVKNSKNNLEASLQSSEEEIGQLNKKVQSIKEALAREKKQLAQLQTNRSELEQQRQQQQRAIKATIRQAYQLGQQSHIKLLLNQQEPDRVGRLMRYHDYIIGAQQEQIARYQHTIASLDEVETRIIASQQALSDQQKQLQQRQQQLISSQQQRRQTLKQLNSNLKQKGQELKKLTADRQRLQALLDQMQSALANIQLPNGASNFASAKGKLPMPTKGPIIHRYGSPQFGGKLKRNGIVIRNNTGAEVVSVHHGRVIFSDYLRGHGLLLIIDHGDGYMSLYGHNQTLLKETGDWANSGEVIATVGNSGGQQQVGLYFEIRHQGRPQNPQRWLARN